MRLRTAMLGREKLCIHPSGSSSSRSCRSSRSFSFSPSSTLRRLLLPFHARQSVDATPRPRGHATFTRRAMSQGQEQQRREDEKRKETDWEDRPRKRNVAFFYGYVGTNYFGSMINEVTAPQKTVESKLFKGIHDMGGVLPSNYEDPRKVKMARASRTDKGVHALANVMTLKVETPYDYWLKGNKDGREFVEKINAELPDDIRVFSATPVTQGFTPRAFCNQRTYDFYIPANILKLKLNVKRSDKGGEHCKEEEENEEKAMATLSQSLEHFRDEVLPLFCGYLPYHNFTVKRLYGKKLRVKQKQKLEEKHAKRRKRIGEDHHSHSQNEREMATASLSQEQDYKGEVKEPKAEGKDSNTSSKNNALAVESTSDDGEIEIETFCKNVKWFHTFNAKTKLEKSHYRRIHSVTCDTELLRMGEREGDDGNLENFALRVTITGESFMYHQIRHMIGLIIAAYRGLVPAPFISAVLAAPANVALPFAPAQTLVLKGLSFGPFARTNFRSRDPKDCLAMTEEGVRLQSVFEEEKLRPSLGDFLNHSDWQAFDEELTEWSENLEPAGVERFMETCQAWKDQLSERRRKAQNLSESSSVSD